MYILKTEEVIIFRDSTEIHFEDIYFVDENFTTIEEKFLALKKMYHDAGHDIISGRTFFICSKRGKLIPSYTIGFHIVKG